MKKIQYSLITLLSVVLTFISCDQIKEKLDDNLKDRFVRKFNAVSHDFSGSSRIKEAYAFKDSLDEVNVVFKLNEVQEDDEFTMDFISKMLPDIVSMIIKDISTSKRLIGDGHSFVTQIRNSEDSIVSTLRIDETKLTEIENRIKNKSSEFVLCDVPKNISKVIVTLNNSLPVEDKSTGLTLVKISLNEDKKLVYGFKTSKEAEMLIQSELLRDLFKENLKNEPSIQSMKNMFSENGIDVVRYRFTNESNEELRNIDIPFNEI